VTEQFEQIAAGATEVEVKLRKGDLTVRAGEGERWSLRWSSAEEHVPRVWREGAILRIEQPKEAGDLFGGQQRMDVELTIPPGVERSDLSSGHGRIEAQGLSGRAGVHAGHGGVTLRGTRAEVDLHSGHGALVVEDQQGRLHAHTGHGGVRVEGLRGDAELRTGHGNVDLIDADGHVHLRTGHGRIEIVSCGGEVDVSTGHGGIEVTGPRSLSLRVENGNGTVQVSGGSVSGLNVRTGRGDLRCSADLQPGSFDLHTSMGSIEVALAADARARVTAHTGFGHIDSHVPLVQVGRSGPMPVGGGRMVGSIGEGDPLIELSLRSGKGDLRIVPAHGDGDQRWERPWRRPAATTAGPARRGPSDQAFPRPGMGAWAGPGPRIANSAERFAEAVGRGAERIAEIVEREIAPEIERHAERIARRVEDEVGPAVEQRVNDVVERFTGGAVRSAQTPMPPPGPPTPPGAPAPPSTTDPGYPASPAGPHEAFATPASAAPPPQLADPVLRILEAVARGEITPQDAERLLAAG
jgi:hypothetical protein